MATPTIVQQVENLLDSLLKDSRLSEEVEYLQKELGISRKDLLSAWVYWDTAIGGYSNDVYSSRALRLAMHLHNYLPDSWHGKRQSLVLGYLNQIRASRICEIGFGTPQRYVQKCLAKGESQILLGDNEDSSIHFAEKLLEYWNKDWRSQITLTAFDMNLDQLPKGYDTYIFQDSLEHAVNPSGVLSNYVREASRGANFIFSLPIEVERPVPEHSICWKDGGEVLGWLSNHGLSVIDHEEISMNKKVDLFSLCLHPDFREVVVTTRKN